MFSFLIFLGLMELAQCNHGKVEFSRIKYYELVYFDVDITRSNIFEFTAFNQTYKIELIENEDMIPSNIKYSASIPIPKHDEYFTSLTKSCHYYGKVLNDNHDPIQRVSLSLCDKRGIRGEIRAFNETIIIKPSKYYLDPQYDRTNFHDITDEHLVWRWSDFDTTDIPDAMSIDIESPPSLDMESVKRRRTVCSGGCNGGNNYVELYVATDPSETRYYHTLYGTSWYQQLSSAVADYTNSISSKYGAVDFKGWGIGVISVHLVELEVIWQYSGDYASLVEGCVSADSAWPCTQDSNRCECTIDGLSYLYKFTTFVQTHKDQSTFDNAQLLSAYYFTGAGGWGWVGSVCKDNSVSNVVTAYGTANTVRHGAHELGHNFGAQHDAGKYAPTCPLSAGIMGSAYDGFSTCSLTAMRNYFLGNNGLTCLGNGVRGFKSNYDANGGSTVDNGNNNNNNNNAASSSYSCVGIASLSPSLGVDFNGYFSKQDSYYTKDGYVLYFKSDWNAWVIDQNFNGKPYVYCDKSDISLCKSGAWKYVSNGGWVADNDAFTYECDDGTCYHYNCIAVAYVERSWDGNDLTGYYSPNGCHNDAAVYNKGDKFIYKTSSGLWHIYTEASDTNAYIYCSKSDITQCGNQWMYYNAQTKQWAKDTNSYTWDCANAFNIESGCNDEDYDDVVCIRDGDDDNEWKVLDKICENDNAVYYFERKNTSYYLHYQLYKEYTDDEEMQGKWVISMNEILGLQYAFCKESDLSKCTSGEWYWFVDADSDAISVANHNTISIHNCEDNGDHEDIHNWSVILMVALFICILICIGIACCMYCRRNKSHKIKVKDEESDQEIQVEVENVIITQTDV